MSLLQVTGLHHAYGAQPVLRGIDLEVAAGSVTALLGSSGSGKTTLLRLIGGFEPAAAGAIAMGGRVLQDPGTHVPAERRRIGYVPQEGTLFPHLTVAGNVGFGLPRAERRGPRVQEVLELTGLQTLANRYPHQLSGGQQQRTALARALAPRPALVLLDEPFNALDLDLRRSVCADVIAALRRAGSTAILVTHDPQEAFASADAVAVMADGLIVQSGSPATVYRTPSSAAVARLTGPGLFLEAVPEQGAAATVLGLLPLTGPVPAAGSSPSCGGAGGGRPARARRPGPDRQQQLPRRSPAGGGRGRRPEDGPAPGLCRPEHRPEARRDRLLHGL